MNRALRVVMITHGYFPRIGGAERQLSALAPLLRARGVDLHVLTRQLPGVAAFEEIEGVPVRRLPASGPKAIASLAFTLASLREIARLKPDVIHAHEMISPTTAALLAKSLLGIPVVVTIHSSGAPGEVQRLKRRPLGPQRLKIYCREIDRFVILSREIETELAAEGVPPERRVVIPNGVNTGAFTPVEESQKAALRAQLGLPAGAPLALYTGRLSPEKGVDRLVSLWPAVLADFPGACLVIAGSGPLEPSLRAAAGQGIRFTGGLNDVRPYLQAADVFVLPSDTEGMSLSLLEAMSCGLPALAFRVGGNPDLITNGETGFLANPADPNDLRAILVRLFGDEALRRQTGARARAHIMKNYDLRTCAERHHACYTAVARVRKEPAWQG